MKGQSEALSESSIDEQQEDPWEACPSLMGQAPQGLGLLLTDPPTPQPLPMALQLWQGGYRPCLP